MKADEARKLAFENSKKMNAIYAAIRESAKRGNDYVTLHTGMAAKEEIEILRSNGFICSYETSEIDGGQFLQISWLKN